MLKNRVRVNRMIIALIVMVSSYLLMINFSKVDNIPYYKTIEKGLLDYSDFSDSGSELDSITDDCLLVSQGSGVKLFYADVVTKEKSAFAIHFEVNNRTHNNAAVYVDLYSSDYDNPYSEVVYTIKPGKNEFSGHIAHFDDNTANECKLRIFTHSDTELEITNLSVDRAILTKESHFYVWIGIGITAALCICSFAYLMSVLIHAFRCREVKDQLSCLMRHKEIWKEIAMYAAISGVVSFVLFLIYGNANLRYPLVYSGGDEMGIYYLVKTIRDYGTSLFNPMTGGLAGGDMFDYPYSDLLSFVIVKFISLFTRDPYLITNLFYFLNYYLIAFAAAFVCRRLGFRYAVSSFVGILFAFSYFIQGRYAHMWLTPYYMLPVACLIAVWIIDGKFLEDIGTVRHSIRFWACILAAYGCAFTGLYYAYFSCALFAAAMVIRLLSAERRNVIDELYPIAFVFATIIGVLVNVAPNLLFWAINGSNPASELALRSGSDAEYYALKMVQMLLPRQRHRIKFLSDLSNSYASTYPLVNENGTAALGVIASIGFIMSLLSVLSQKKKCRTYACLNLSMFLIGTIGGIGSVLSVFISMPMRCYNRLSLVIMFLSLLVVAVYLEDIGKKLKPYMVVVLCGLLIVVGLYDQTTEYKQPYYGIFEETRMLVNEIEDTLSPGDMVFQLPYDNWPTGGTYRNHICYVESEDIHWSYGAMQGRQEARWQQAVASEDMASMVEYLRAAGYDGLWMDRKLYTWKHGEEKYEEDVKELSRYIGCEPVISWYGAALFWDIR